MQLRRGSDQMDLQIANGVQAHIQATNKFKTVLIEYKFRTLYEPETATARTLLKNILVTNTKKYASQKALDNQMSWLYGASLSSGSQRYGDQHVVTFRLNVVNDRYIGGDDHLLEEAFSFLREIIHHPNVENKKFHQKTFDREKINLKHYFGSLNDDKSRYAVMKLNQLLFKGTKQRYLGMGSEEYLDEITSQSLYQTYQSMIESDTVDVLVSGDVSLKRIDEILKKESLQDRQALLEFPFVTLPTRDIVEKVEEVSEVIQGKLLLGFHSPAYYNESTYFAGIVFNGLFGGFPHSKLFQNVREKESLAYSASSFMDFIRGTMVVQTGIAFDKKDQVEEIVLEQLEAMKKGDFSDLLFVQTKDMLINHYNQNDDSQSGSLSKVYSNRILRGKDFSDDEWLAGVSQVTKEEVMNLAGQLTLQALFFLKGEELPNA